MPRRQIKEIRPAKRADLGEMYTRAPMSGSAEDRLDPFLVLAHHGPQDYAADSARPPSSPHPHRGFETVTFIVGGDLVHKDSAGHRSLIGAGGVQWLTAGSGVVHSEQGSDAFWKTGGRLELLQLWVNLPARLKMSAPRYAGVEASEIPSAPLPGGGALRLVSGEFDRLVGPVESLTGVFISTVSLPGGAHACLPAPQGRTVLFYVIQGQVAVNGVVLSGGDLVTFSEGDGIDARGVQDALVLFGHGDPIGEPVVNGGPFVMNSQAEIEAAFSDYRSGRFGRV